MDKGKNFNEAVLAVYNEQGEREAVTFLIQRGRSTDEAIDYLDKLTNPEEEILQEEENEAIKGMGEASPEKKDSFLDDSSETSTVKEEDKQKEDTKATGTGLENNTTSRPTGINPAPQVTGQGSTTSTASAPNVTNEKEK